MCTLPLYLYLSISLSLVYLSISKWYSLSQFCCENRTCPSCGTLRQSREKAILSNFITITADGVIATAAYLSSLLFDSGMALNCLGLDDIVHRFVALNLVIRADPPWPYINIIFKCNAWRQQQMSLNWTVPTIRLSHNALTVRSSSNAIPVFHWSSCDRYVILSLTLVSLRMQIIKSCRMVFRIAFTRNRRNGRII